MSREREFPEEPPQYAEEVEPWSYEVEGVSGAPLPPPRKQDGKRRGAPETSRPQLQLPPAMPPREAKKRRLTPLSIGLGAGAIGCFALAVGLWANSALSSQKMAELSPIDDLVEDAELVTEDHDGLPLTDEEAAALEPDPWEGAEESYPGLAAWLEVEGTGISTPVMQATEDAPDWFLNHDAFGNESANGLPYLDYQCRPFSEVKTIYAHNLGWGSSEGFGSLAEAWQQDKFDSIGNLTIASSQGVNTDVFHEPIIPENGMDVRTYYPICALKVEPDNTSVVCVETAPDHIVRWLEFALDASSASAENAKVGAALSESAVALVTCSGDGYPSESRTVVFFAGRDPDDPTNQEIYLWSTQEYTAPDSSYEDDGEPEQTD